MTQRVAVKLLRPGVDDRQLRRRFLAERQILATLSHPNIAKLLDAGHREDGQPYLVMEYVEGKPIEDYIAGISTRQKITLFLKVCAAVSYLHRNLIVHRDLKPGNILVTDDGEPKLLDFGIAKLLDLNTDATATGERMLTPDYASPEQVDGCPITTATDIYSLGAVLYRILTGASPHQFEGDSPAAIALAISSGRITPPSKLRASLEGRSRDRPDESPAQGIVRALCLGGRFCRRSARVSRVAASTGPRGRGLVSNAQVPAALLGACGCDVCGDRGPFRQPVHGQPAACHRRTAVQSTPAAVRQGHRSGPGNPHVTRLDRSQAAAGGGIARISGRSPREAQGNLDVAREIGDGYWRMGRIQGVNAEFNLGDTRRAEVSLRKADGLIETVLAARPRDRSAIFRSAVIAHDRMILADTEERWADVQVHARKAVERLEAGFAPMIRGILCVCAACSAPAIPGRPSAAA